MDFLKEKLGIELPEVFKSDKKDIMYNEELESLVKAALTDGVLTEKEKQILFNKAQSMGINLDEFEMMLNARLVELQKAEKEKIEKSAPKSNKYGDVRKCPSCGAVVPSLATSCAECGYEFVGIDANLSSKKLADLLLSTKNLDKKKDIIETFPIPLTKVDLFEFLASLQPRIKDVNDPLAISYFKKYQECIIKAKSSFADDPKIKPFIESFNVEEKRFNKRKNINAIKKLTQKKWFKFVVIALCIGLFFIVRFIISYDNTAELMVDAVNKGQLDKATTLYTTYKGKKYDLHDELALVFWAYWEMEDIKNAENILNLLGAVLDDSPFLDSEKRNNDMAMQLYDYYIKNGEYDKARMMIEKSDSNYQLWGTHIMDVVVALCEKGDKVKAKRYLDKYVGNISDQYDNLGLDSYPTKDGGSTILGDRKYVTKLINDVIKSY